VIAPLRDNAANMTFSCVNCSRRGLLRVQEV
jgi:hypothetical protein